MSRAFHCAATELVKKRDFDILYLDPPYNDRCYAGYYHLPETIALQATPNIHGKSEIPRRRTVSSFNRKDAALAEMKTLLKGASFRVLAFHYSDDGLIPKREIRQLLKSYGKLSEMVLSVRGYTTEKKRRTIHQRLYIVDHG